MTEETLRDIVSVLGKIDRGQVTAETPLTGSLGNSFGRARLDANVRSKLGITHPAIYSVATFGELCTVLGVESSANGAASAAHPSPAPPLEVFGPGSVRVGVDVEQVQAMPAAADYWEDDFYKSTFTAREIAYAVLQASPQASFAAMWCAKEALRKIDESLARLDWQKIEVIRDGNGKPSIMVDGRPAAGALSLSHTDEIAFAVFVLAPQPEPVAPASPTPPLAAVELQGHHSRITAILAALALLVSTVALAVSFVRH